MRPFPRLSPLLLCACFACLLTRPAWPQDAGPEAIPEALQAAGLQVQEGSFEGYPQSRFQLDGVACIIVRPHQPAAGRPWIWRARFWGHEPQFDRAMLERGWHVCYCDVAGLFGADAAVQRWDVFYDLTQQLGLHPKAFLEGMSRGGLIIMRWAGAHPERVAGIYGDNAVFDMRSWPGGTSPGGTGTSQGSPSDWQQCLKAYGLSAEQAAAFADGPLQRLAPLAAADVPILLLINEADEVVPPAENGDRLVALYRQLGGPIREIRRPGLGHHPHSLKDPTPLVEFALATLK